MGTSGINSLATVLLLGTCVIVGVFSAGAAEAPDANRQLLTDAQKQLQPLPKDGATEEFPLTPERVSLGRKLFFDPRMSGDGTVSCNRCHLAALYGTDALPKSIGAHDLHAPRNASTVFNTGIYIAQHWRGEMRTVEEQAQRALSGPAFGNPDGATALKRIKAIPGYSELFEKAFPNESAPVSEVNWGKAIGAFERTLMTPSRFDDYLRGKRDALTESERKGLRLFLDTGCADCHSGAGLGGSSFEKFGVVEDYWEATGSKDIDVGRMEVTKKESDKHVFKVPGLRNVEMTPPYFHDGSVKTLPEAVRIMARVQLGKTLSDDDTTGIVTFLKSLTGAVPKDFAEAPVLSVGAFGVTP
jgi:cytochrome c peroxidase